MRSIARRFSLSASTVHGNTKKNLREAVKEAQWRLFDRDVEQASVALKALDAAIDGLSGKTDEVSINQPIRLIGLKQSLLSKDTKELHIAWVKALERPCFSRVKEPIYPTI
jgi:hypothetical protein